MGEEYYNHHGGGSNYLCLMKDSLAFRGPVLWNAVTINNSALTKNIPYRDLRLKLKSQANFNDFGFKITSASTCNFRKDDFVYT